MLGYKAAKATTMKKGKKTLVLVVTHPEEVEVQLQVNTYIALSLERGVFAAQVKVELDKMLEAKNQGQ